MNHKLSTIIMRKLQKLLEADIIILSCIQIVFPHCTYQKKNGEIYICIDFINLNLTSLKDNYTLPSMEHVLQELTDPG